MSWRAVRTVAVLELRQRVRSTRWQVMLVIWGVVLVVLCGGMATLAGMAGGTTEDIAPALYDLTVCFVLGIGLIVAPTLSATSINGDRADATLALLQATALRSSEIVAGKLLAAWVAALAFLAVALPFLILLTAVGGATWAALTGHLLVLALSLGAVCAVGLGFSAATARASASAVLTYLVVAALVIGTPLITAIATTTVRGEQRQIIYSINYDSSTNSEQVCFEEPEYYTSEIVHTERIWWMLIPNPFVALSDISVRNPLNIEDDGYLNFSLLAVTGLGIDSMRDPQPEEIVRNYCDDDSSPEYNDSDGDYATADHLAFWPASLTVLVLIGIWPAVFASRRLRTPARKLARGTRVA